MSILDDFDVVEVPRTFSIAEVRVLKNKISFNVSAASVLGYPPFVRVFISHDKTQIALQPCDKTTPNAMKFFTAETAEKKHKRTIGVGNKALATLIKSGMGWEMAQPVCAPGIRFSEENVIIFDLKQAQMCGKGQTGGTGICLIPRPAAPFFAVPSQYFANDGGVVVIDADGEVVSA